MEVSLHIYDKGPHGLGLGAGDHECSPIQWHPWTRDCIFWLKEQGFMKNEKITTFPSESRPAEKPKVS